MINYPKIESLFKRDPKTKYKTFLDEYSMPEFEYLKDCQWEWVEKIDGTNIKIFLDPESPGKSVIGGRTENAQIPSHLFEYLHLLTTQLLNSGILDAILDCPVTLYGEGYGPKINGGGKYRDDVGFILFDIRIGEMWLRRKDIWDIGHELGIDVAPYYGTFTCQEAVQEVKKGFLSAVGDCQAEGLIGQPYPRLLTRLGKRIITKIKTKDFNHD